MQTESQKSQLRSQQGMTEVFFDGGSVIVPVEQESAYLNALAEKWIDGYRVYIKNGEVCTDHNPSVHTMSPRTMIDLLINANDKRYAMAGKY